MDIINLSNVTTAGELIRAINIDYPFYVIVYYFVYVIVLLYSMISLNIIDAITLSGLIGFFIGIFLVYAGLIPFNSLLVVLSITLLVILISRILDY